MPLPEPRVNIMWSATLTGFSFFDQVRVSAELGYRALSIHIDTVEQMSEEGITPRALRAFAEDHGVALTVLEPVVSWLPLDPGWRPGRFSLDAIEQLGIDLGISSVCAIAARTTSTPMTENDIAEHFEGLAQRFHQHGWTTCIEFIPMSSIRDLPAAGRLADRAADTDAGIIFDTWHFLRGEHRADQLTQATGDQIRYVQVSDASTEWTGSLGRDTYNRLLPTENSLDLIAVLESLDRVGALSAVGPEVISPGLSALSCAEAARAATDACNSALSVARRRRGNT